MSSIHLINTLGVGIPFRSLAPSVFPQCHSPLLSSSVPKRRRLSHSAGFRIASGPTVNSVPVSLLFFGSRFKPKSYATVIFFLFCIFLYWLCFSFQRGNGTYTVADFMTKKQNLHVVKTTTSVDDGMVPLIIAPFSPPSISFRDSLFILYDFTSFFLCYSFGGSC